ncbi:unnamed protein product [Durusdinium trenchii]|uniref:Uncharacterized protein n=2 Tax=Durusdinium trenchii TaxID=1381693 RepID=A0ABP0S345_9DINO
MAASAKAGEDEEEEEEDDMYEFDEDEPEHLPCSLTYVMVCILMPCLNGMISGYCWSGLTLHYRAMGWPIARAGLGGSLGFMGRIFMQQVQLRLGFWAIIPLNFIHLIGVILGILYTDQEWAVCLEVVLLQSLDAAITIEGLAFDVFGSSENLASQASSTMLAIYTMSAASAVTVGGILYDTAGWQGMSIFHLILQAILAILFIVSPQCRSSFTEFFQKKVHEAEAKEEGPEELSSVVPSAPTTSGAAVIEEPTLPGLVEDEVLSPLYEEDGGAKSSNLRGSMLSAGGEASLHHTPVRSSNFSATPNASPQRGSVGELKRSSMQDGRSSMRSGRATGRMSQQSRKSGVTFATRNTNMSRMSAASHRSRMSAVSKLTAVMSLAENDDFQHHFMATGALRPQIAQRAGLQDQEDEDEDLDEEPVVPGGQEELQQLRPEEAKPKKKGLKKDLWLPAFLLVLCSLNNYLSYAMEYGTFAIFFKEYHGWTSATWASLCQTAGDLFAAVMIKLMALYGPSEDPMNAGCFERWTRQPYNLSWLLFFWILCSAGMCAPPLAVAVIAQILMGTVFVYCSKTVTDLNLFYSLGDPDVYLTLQVYCKNADAVGGCTSCFVALLLYDTVSPFAPFAVAAGFSTLMFVLYTAGFCHRLGFGEDIETAEHRRARRLGMVRTSRWTVSSRKSTVRLDEG